MADSNYFDHQSPNYGSPFEMMQTFGVDYRAAGENIAMGQRSPEEVMNGWMNSEGHRKNIKHDQFTHLGVGYVREKWTNVLDTNVCRTIIFKKKGKMYYRVTKEGFN